MNDNNQQAAREWRLSDAQRAVLHNLANGRPAAGPTPPDSGEEG